MEQAGVWGVAAGVLHFVPYLGPVLVASRRRRGGFLQFGTLLHALAVAGVALLVAAAIGMVFMTWLQSRFARVNAAVLFIALLFFGWLWGVAGLLLGATPGRDRQGDLRSRRVAQAGRRIARQVAPGGSVPGRQRQAPAPHRLCATTYRCAAKTGRHSAHCGQSRALEASPRAVEGVQGVVNEPSIAKQHCLSPKATMSEAVIDPPAAGDAWKASTSTDLGRTAALLKAGALQNAILTSANFSIIATDEKGIIQLFNVGAERMLGYMAAEVVNRISPSDIHDPQEVTERARALSLELATPIAPGFEALAFKASRGIEDVYELTYICKDGSRFPALVSITALRDDFGDIIGYLLIGSDNSVRKRVESELNEAMAAAETANRAKTDFLSSMSHELRTPLNAILGFAQLLESGSPSPTPPQKRSIEQILKAGWYLLELINEILDLALIESGKVTLSREPVSLVEVMLECRAMIEPQAQKRGIGMTFPRFDTPHFVKADRTRVKQVLINLLFNAIKYNKPGGAVTVGWALSPPDSIRISVRDTGAGLAPEQLAQLFQPFNRLGKEASAEEGTGIGLVVTKRLVELMGGTIGVDSAVGQGSVFWVELTLTAAPQLAVREAERAAMVRPGLPRARRRARCSMWKTIRRTWSWWSSSSRAGPTCACSARRTAISGSSSRAPTCRR